MVRRTLAAVVLLLAVAGLQAAPVPERPALEKPQTPPPTMAAAEIGKDGALLIERTAVRSEVAQVTEEVVLPGGRKEARTRLVPRQVILTTMEKVELKDVQAFGSDGKQIDTAKLAELLKKSTPVLVSTDGQKVDPYYLQLVKEGAVVLVLPAPKAPAAPDRALPPEKK
jgi:hypothetical protein